MPLQQSVVIGQIRTLVAQVTGMQHVYAPSETDTNALPQALNVLPCAVVLPGPTRECKVGNGMVDTTYEVAVRLYEGGGDAGERAASILPFRDLLVNKFIANVTLGARAQLCLYESDSGYVGLAYAGAEYGGIEVTLVVREIVAGTPAPGS